MPHWTTPPTVSSSTSIVSRAEPLNSVRGANPHLGALPSSTGGLMEASSINSNCLDHNEGTWDVEVILTDGLI